MSELIVYKFLIGRPTLDKCKKVKKNRELEAELRAMDVDNIISDDVKESRKARASRGIFNPVRRKVSRATQSSPVCSRLISLQYHIQLTFIKIYRSTTIPPQKTYNQIPNK